MLRLARPLGSVARRQLISRPFLAQARGYAERNDAILSSDPTFKPEKSGPAVPVTPPSPTPATPTSTTTIPPSNIPKTPPPPPTQTQTAPPTDSSRVSPPVSTPPPPPPAPAAAPAPVTPPPPPPPKQSSRARLLLYLLLATALGYGGAVAFALNNDNFHDFFTEYVPFGEDVVLYFEERSFHRRFPDARTQAFRSKTGPVGEKKVTIPHRSGLSWKVSEDEKKDGADVSAKGKHMSAIEENTKAATLKEPDSATKKEKVSTVNSVKKDDPSAKTVTNKAQPKEVSTQAVQPKEISSKDVKPKEAKPESTAPQTSTPSSPKSDTRPPAIAPVTQISTTQVVNADEPVVQELVKIINDLITVVNSDSPEAANRYSAPMQKAKDSLTQVAGKISALRDAERAAGEQRLKDAHKEFDDAAKSWLERIETAKKEDDIKYREEFEIERSKIASQYEDRLKAEIEHTQKVMEQRINNELSEQGINLKRKFVQDIQSLVEAERNGRLSKLSDLSTNVDSLTELTSNWNGIIDANLATQKLQVAVDAVRSSLNDSNSTHAPKPFVREMAALKLVADSDPLVDAAVASINPSAYQKGIPSSAQLIDRFRRVAAEVRKASLLPENAGIASHAASMVLSKVMFKKQGVPEGNDVESVLTRTETLLEEGDLDNAARELNELQGWASVLSRDWLNDARKVLEVQQALDVIETEARLQCLRVE